MARFVALSAVGISVSLSASATDAFPVIGIMAHPTTSKLESCGPMGECEYIAASYVKFVELAGARAVPLSYYSTDEVIDEAMEHLNGILLTGGNAELPRAAKRVVANVVNLSAVGGHFPLWGTCDGFEWIIKAVGGPEALCSGCFDSENISLRLNFTADAEMSRLYADKVAKRIFADEPVTMNMHHDGLEPSEFARNSQLQKHFRVLSTNLDKQGREFVSSIEGVNAPIYATQYHPEKNIFEWGVRRGGTPYEAIQHTADAVQAAQSLANFFVNEGRLNRNAYNLSSTDFFEHLPTNEDKSPEFVQIYHLFPKGTRAVVV